MKQIATVKCTHVIAQVSLGYYDEDGNLVGEEMFPQVDGNLLTAKLFHPHTEQLAKLIGTCIEQAQAKLNTRVPAQGPIAASDGAGGGDGRPRESISPAGSPRG